MICNHMIFGMRRSVSILYTGLLLLYIPVVSGQGIVSTNPVPLGTNGDVRLVGGSLSYEGRVEIFYNNEWGTICDDSWERDDAEVICRQLGYYGVHQFYDQGYFGQGYGPIMRQTGCGGKELYWLQCSYYEWDTDRCNHGEDAGVVCIPGIVLPEDGDVRLRDGYASNSGRVEIYYGGEWGTICKDDWSYNDAFVICHQLGYYGVDTDSGWSLSGSGPIMGALGCKGTELFWVECFFRDWRTSFCNHNNDVGVTCSLSVTYQPRLMDGSDLYEGSETSLPPDAIARIVIPMMFVSVCICVFALVYAKKKRGITSVHPNIAVISGTDNLTAGPDHASQINQNNVAAPPSYYDVVSNPVCYPQCAAGTVQTLESPYPHQSHTSHPLPKPNFFNPHLIEMPPPPQYSAQPPEYSQDQTQSSQSLSIQSSQNQEPQSI